MADLAGAVERAADDARLEKAATELEDLKAECERVRQQLELERGTGILPQIN